MKSHLFIRPSLFAALIILSLAISCSRDEMSPSITDQEVDEIEVGDDPEFVAEESSVSNARIGTVELGGVSVYLSKDDGAYGKVFIQIFDRNDKRIYKSGTLNVSYIKVSDEASKKYTHMYVRPRVTLNMFEPYRVEVRCQSCSDASAGEPGVYWWASTTGYENAVYTKGNRWVTLSRTNFAFATTNLKPDGSPYGDISHIVRETRYPINDPSILYAQTFKPLDTRPCDVFDQLSIDNISVTSINDEIDDKEVTFDITNYGDEEVFIGDIILQKSLSNDRNATASTIAAGGAFINSYKKSLDPGERKTFRDTYNSKGYKYLIVNISYTGRYEDDCSEHFTVPNF